jgi:hypothetical protein
VPPYCIRPSAGYGFAVEKKKTDSDGLPAGWDLIEWCGSVEKAQDIIKHLSLPTIYLNEQGETVEGGA